MFRRISTCVMMVLACLALAGCISGNTMLDHEVTVEGLVMKVPSSWKEEQVEGADDTVRFVPSDGGEGSIEVAVEEGYQPAVDAYRYLLDQQHADEDAGVDRTWEVAREMRLDEWTCNVFNVTEPAEGDDAGVSYQRAVIYGPTATYTVDVYGSKPNMELLLKTVGFAS